MERDWEYIAGRNQASRQYHKQKRKEAEEEIATLRDENEKLREALEAVVITKGRKMKYDEGYETYDPIDLAKEALK